MAHLLEVGTGFRNENPEDPGPGEPRPCYDPAITTLTERRWAKVAELAAMDREEARLIALGPDGPREVGSIGWMIDTSQYFIDLHTVAGLITLTWPAAKDLALSDEHARILERDAQLREDLRGRLHAVRGKFHYLHVLTSPAPDSRAYVAATGIAHQILKGTDLRALEMLAPIRAHLQKVQDPMKAEGDRMRNSPKNSPPLRSLLTRRTR
jgi:hypothetical protein